MIRIAAYATLLTTAASIPLSEAHAEKPRFHELEGFGNFLDGNPESTAITESGTVVLPPTVRERYTDPAAVFSAAAPLGNEIAVARSDDGQILAIDRAGKTRRLFKVNETVVTAMASRGDTLFVAAGPPARLYRVPASGKPQDYYGFDAQYVWDLAVAEGGSLWAATGKPGRVVRVEGPGEGEVIFEPEQAHLRAIHHDSELGLFVGGGEDGIVYRAADRQRFRALFDSGLNEITGMVTLGTDLYAAAVSGANAVASQGSSGDDDNNKNVKVRSQLVRVGMDGASETLAGSNDEAIFAVARDHRERVLVATGATGRRDPRGRIYAIEPDERMVSMLYQSKSRRLTALFDLPRKALAAVGADGGRLIHLTGGIAPEGVFLSTPFDAGVNSRYGTVEVFGEWPQGTRVRVAVRSGQTKTPDDTWSEWSQDIDAPGRKRVRVPNGRYAQLRLTLSSDGSVSPSVYRARLAYLRQNLPPFVREVVALRRGLALEPLRQRKRRRKTVNLDNEAGKELRRGDDEEAEKPRKAARARRIERPGALTIKWVAKDPNGDDLKYDLAFRPAGDGGWIALEDELEEPFFTLDSAQLPDGHYEFRVRASDAPSNPPMQARDDKRESRAVLVDNTPPRVRDIEIEQRGQRTVIRFVASDAVGPLSDAGYSLDGQPFEPVHPDDGILDGPGEAFTLRLGELASGPHTLTIRIFDAAGNPGTGQKLFDIP